MKRYKKSVIVILALIVLGIFAVGCQSVGCTDVPEFTGEVQDVRITAVERENARIKYQAQFDDRFDYPLIQIYYGYQIDGVWHDIPSENYSLRGIFFGSRKKGYEAARQSHVVQIGSYYMVCIREFDAQDAGEQGPTDSLGTIPMTPLTDYCGDSYGYYREDKDSKFGKLEYEATFPFEQRYYFLLEADSLPEDYTIFAGGKNILTLEDIQNLLKND